ncbi:MAG: leucyl aminopeptidase family protein [Thalassobaculum sp.]|uniref:leucyl aminopeptidase family protein n=1 Tax=Thalassobaculum sp. TaxID=2022740 RepID=UPI0032EB1B2F
MAYNLVGRATAGTVPLTPIAASGLDAWLAAADGRTAAWVRATGFKAKAGEVALLPDDKGGMARVLLGVEAVERTGLWDYAGLPGSLPAGRYAIDTAIEPADATRAALGWALATYRFDRYTAMPAAEAELVWPKGADRAHVERAAAGTALARDLVNTPANDLGPTRLAEVAKALAKEFKAKFSVLVGDQLLKKNYPTIHAVGRGATDAPRLIDLTWGDPSHPKVTLVGKGVCFDTGGYDIKPSSGMLTMKKDMGGSAQVLGLARMIMDAGLKVRLRVLVPAVKNMISGDAFLPMDVIRTRKGLTVEIGNTDAEGRLVLCDALAEADAEKPDLLLDYATLTGAARVALGTDLPALFSNDDSVAADWTGCGLAEDDPVWRLPLHAPYKAMLKTKIADLSNTGSAPFAGAITAALFLEHFVSPTTRWAHIDLMAWNTRDRPGRPEGGEAMAMRSAFRMIEQRFGS